MHNVPIHFTVFTNISLAVIPVILSYYLFKVSRQRGYLWWPLLLIMIAFLPNSAYVLTDVIHFIAAINSPEVSLNYLIFVLLPLFTLYFVLCFEFYVLSIEWTQQYLCKQSMKMTSKLYVPCIHFLCAIGVYLGRVQRLESDDIVRHPWLVFKDLRMDLSEEYSLLSIIGLFIAFYLFYQIFISINGWVSATLKRYYLP